MMQLVLRCFLEEDTLYHKLAIRYTFRQVDDVYKKYIYIKFEWYYDSTEAELKIYSC